MYKSSVNEAYCMFFNTDSRWVMSGCDNLQSTSMWDDEEDDHYDDEEDDHDDNEEVNHDDDEGDDHDDGWCPFVTTCSQLACETFLLLSWKVENSKLKLESWKLKVVSWNSRWVMSSFDNLQSTSMWEPSSFLVFFLVFFSFLKKTCSQLACESLHLLLIRERMNIETNLLFNKYACPAKNRLDSCNNLCM